MDKSLIDRPRIEAAVREILLAIGEDPERDGVRQTPERVARMFDEIFSGVNGGAGQFLETTFDVEHRELILFRDIEFFSMCEHHLMPFHGQAHIAYIPNGRVTGLSKVVRTGSAFPSSANGSARRKSKFAHEVVAVSGPTAIVWVLAFASVIPAMSSCVRGLTAMSPSRGRAGSGAAALGAGL